MTHAKLHFMRNLALHELIRRFKDVTEPDNDTN